MPQMLLCLLAFAASADAPASPEAVCPKCERTVEPAWRHCPDCGAKLPVAGTISILGWRVSGMGELIWVIIGFAGQACFGGRFLVQWIVSEKRGESVVPPVFWYMSLVGGLMILSYAIYRMDPIFILAQALNPILYLRNIILMRRKRSAPPV